MKKTLLTTSLFFTLAFAKSQNLIKHYNFDSYGNNLVQSGSGTPNSFITPGASINATDTCVQFYNGQGLESSGPIYNVFWTATAISVWYNSAATYSGYIVQGAYIGFGLYILPSGVVNVFFDGSYSGAIGSVVSVNDGTWHHIVAQNNGATTQIYIDGSLTRTEAESLYTMPFQNPSAKLIFGNSANDISGDKIYGKLDEFKLFSDILSQADISALYQYGNNSTTINETNFTKSTVNIFPNPVKDYLNINSIVKINKATIYSINGSVVKTLNTFDKKIDVSNLSQGMYIIVLESDHGISQNKFIKE